MVHQPPKEYFLRSAFPRGRMLSHIEDDLTILAQLIARYEASPKEKFDENIDREYAKLRSASAKSIKNYRTEMTKLFGLVVVDEGGIVEASSRTATLIETQNFHLFFKSFCNRFQFPNCINKPQETVKQLEAGVKFKPAKFILRLFLLGIKQCGETFSLNGNEISNLVFNDLRVTTGQVGPDMVLKRLLGLRKGKERFAGRSRMVQHGREFLGYMMLAKLLKQDGREFSLNAAELPAINSIIEDNSFFEIPKDYSTDPAVRKNTQVEWALWYGELSRLEITKLTSAVSAVETKISVGEEAVEFEQPAAEALKEIGDKGEWIVLKYEKEKIGQIRPDKVSLVKIVSNDTELGYDIQSFEFEDVSKKKFIEVKTTERTFPPALDILTFFPMSSNEWETAKNYGQSYYIYRVFLIATGSKMFIIQDPVDKEKKGFIILEPLKYRVIVKKQAGDYIN